MRVVAFVAAALLLVGCSQNYYKSYRVANPDWYGDFPTAGAPLHETLAGIYAPRVADATLLVTKIRVLELRGGLFGELSPPEIDRAIASEEPATYGVIAATRCQGKVGLRTYVGDSVSWFLLPDGRLTAWDAPQFVDDDCTVYYELRPAKPGMADLERQLTDARDADFPPAPVHVVKFYRYGIAYASAGRLDDAKAMLAAGDAGFDVSSRGERPSPRGPGFRQSGAPSKSELDRMRESLVAAIGRLEKEGTE